mmetsp:Transcript_1269/g.4668  ORF Transcript_1269/g.4668 Transcript_1269/m.4668 type:complete len:402 (-) Transcript_1269:3750-4955(-)
MGSKVDLDRHKRLEPSVRAAKVHSVDLASEVCLLLRPEGLASRPRRRRLGKPKPRHRSPAVVRLLSARQPQLVALDRVRERLLSALVAAEVRSVNKHLPKAHLGALRGPEPRGGLEEAGVHLVVEANKAADYLELVVPLHRKLRHLELQRNRARCLGINRNKINPRPLVNLRKVLASARLNNNNLDHSSAPSRLLHLLVVFLELHLNKRVVGAACSGPRERRWEVLAVLAALRHRSSLRRRVLVDSAGRKGNNSSSKMLSVRRNLPGGAVYLERSKLRAAARSLIKEANNLGSALRHKRRQVSVLPSSNKEQPARFSVLNLLKHQEVFLVRAHQRRRLLSLEEERRRRQLAVKAALALRQEVVDFLAPRSLRRRHLVAVHNNRAPADYLVQLGLVRAADYP